MRVRWWWLVLAVACKPVDDPDDEPAPQADDLANPLVPEVPLLPWPSDQYLVTTDDGPRISIGDDLLPEGIEARLFEGHDGFSRVVPIVTFLPGGYDPASLPPHDDWGATLSSDSPVLLVREGTFELVPVLVEPDSTAPNDNLRSLLIRPHRALDPSTRYAVILTNGLRRADGTPHEPNATIRKLLADEPSDNRAIASWRPRFDLVREAAEAHGVELDDIVQAWTFTTRSKERVIHSAVALQDQAAEAELGSYTLDEPKYKADMVTVEGTLTVPLYLDAEQRIRFDENGEPIVQGTMEAPFLITVPRTVTDTRPTLLVGHGFFSDITETTWSNLFDALALWQTPAVSTRFLGFSENDLLQAATLLGGSLSEIDRIVDQQLQSHVNFTLVWRMVVESLADEFEIDFGDGPFRPLQGERMSYIGASNGGTQGLVLMTTSHVLDRGALVVPGGGWSHMLQRASQWHELGLVVANRYGDTRHLQLVMSMLQQSFDRIDSLNFVDHLVKDRLEGRHPDPEILLVEAVNDTQVANLVTRWVAGNAGIPLITPAPFSVWGVDEVPADQLDGVRAAMAMYDFPDVDDVPPGNVAPQENGVHGRVRTVPAYREQVGTFLLEGRITHTCDGPCDPE